ncbi:MAG: hypothetical protein ACJ79R_12675, partial [Anaeromyxobacteraceae bacterium]
MKPRDERWPTGQRFATREVRTIGRSAAFLGGKRCLMRIALDATWLQMALGRARLHEPLLVPAP